MPKRPGTPQRAPMIGGALVVAAMVMCCAATLIGWAVGAWRVLG